MYVRFCRFILTNLLFLFCFLECMCMFLKKTKIIKIICLCLYVLKTHCVCAWISEPSQLLIPAHCFSYRAAITQTTKKEKKNSSLNPTQPQRNTRFILSAFHAHTLNALNSTLTNFQPLAWRLILRAFYRFREGVRV
jgi:hypothetical protein